jgi:Zn-dependent M28 family amino/carboxypeptidase
VTATNRRLLAPLVALVVLVASCTGEESPERSSPAPDATPSPAPELRGLSRRIQRAVTVGGIVEHLRAFQAIADANGGTRASGTPGYDASVRYVARRLREAGYDVDLQEFTFPVFEETGPSRLQITGGQPFRRGSDYVPMLYSGAGDARGPVSPVDLDLDASSSTSGCTDDDFSTFVSGHIALMQRGFCFFRDQAQNAEDAGATAAVIVQERERADEGAVRGTLTPSGASSIPVIGVSYDTGLALAAAADEGDEVIARVDSIVEDRTTRNVIAETDAGAASRVMMVGAHLDSVPDGPGINDNGSGSAVILELAEELAGVRTNMRVRFAWWGAEEYGLLGSTHYVEETDGTRALDVVRAYLNFDMVGSPNFVRFVYDGNRIGSSAVKESVRIESLFRRYFDARSLETRPIGLRDRSDHASFAATGIPVGGLFSGADGTKTEAQQEDFGGRAGRQHDPCYHLPCDDIDNVNRKVLHQMGDAIAHVVVTLSQSSRIS